MIYTRAFTFRFSTAYAVLQTQAASIACHRNEWKKWASNGIGFVLRGDLWHTGFESKSTPIGVEWGTRKAQWKYDYSWMNGRRTLLITASDSYGKQNSFITSTKPEKHLRIIDHLINYYAWHQSDDYQTIERFDQLSCECSTQKKVLKRKKGNTNLVDWMAAHEQRLWFYPLPCLLNFYLFRNFSLQFLLLLLQLLFNLYIYSLIHLIAMILFIDTQTLAHWN